MSKQLLAVFGATGNQGGSIIRHVLDDPELSSRYTIRGITRNTSSPEAQALATKRVEVVAADLSKPSTLSAALKDVAFVFATTNTAYIGDTREVETQQAKALCEEALKQQVKYLIWSSMSHPAKISGGKLKNVAHFDVKAEIEQYIRGLPIKSAFVAPGTFMQNVYNFSAPRPSPANDGTYILANIAHTTETMMPMIDITDIGAWISAILADPDKYEGKFFAAAQGLYSNQQMAEIMTKVSGKKVVHQQMPDEQFKSFIPKGMRDMMYEMNAFFRDYGYFGSSMKKDVEWAKQQARGELTDFESFLRKTEFKLE